ncbi:hypothetical protein LVD15_13690 [Fulvivirga maritima]|uniref:POTRA domain-containing protein n=1 Tax=Fulvivirga maritima TaxID=2904247 RepID=UPI001F429CE7|nr:POTRA domain-containing protein [Fulvivirga maritima]UII29434.1 hypothetical protein LVD15_13690 [Fulvivirga maritima]
MSYSPSQVVEAEAFSTYDSIPSQQVHEDSVKSKYVYIDNIFVIGNKRTKKAIILREMSINAGEYFYEPDLEDIIRQDRNKIFNTRLFNTVEVSLLELQNDKVDVVVKVSERWYTFPVPIFDLVDRNFNDWWQNQNHDLSRVNYGLKLFQNNVRGRNERLKLVAQFGYTKQFEVAYFVPYLDKSQRHGISFLYSYADNKNIAYRTVDHKREFLDSEDVLRVQKRYGLGYQFRNSFYSTHRLNLYFNDNWVNDTVTFENSNYYLDNEREQKYFSIAYNFVHDKRNNVTYPLKGSEVNIFARKYGLGIFDDLNQLDLGGQYSKFIDLGKDYYFSNYSSVYVSFPENQPYSNLRGLGYSYDFIRGYELYVVESKSFLLNRSTLKKRLWSFSTDLNFIPIDQFKTVPIDIYFKLYFDMGYSENLTNYDQNTMLTDRYLFGCGAGFDIVSYYDTVIRLEYSMNREMEHGLFVHFRKEF